MPASAAVSNIVEAINDSLGKFSPEKIVPDVEGFLEHFPEIFTALSEQVGKTAGHAEEGLPVHRDVAEGLREMIPLLNGLRDRAQEVFDTFKSRHVEDLKRHYEPRIHEPGWNV